MRRFPNLSGLRIGTCDQARTAYITFAHPISFTPDEIDLRVVCDVLSCTAENDPLGLVRKLNGKIAEYFPRIPRLGQLGIQAFQVSELTWSVTTQCNPNQMSVRVVLPIIQFEAIVHFLSQEAGAKISIQITKATWIPSNDGGTMRRIFRGALDTIQPLNVDEIALIMEELGVHQLQLKYEPLFNSIVQAVLRKASGQQRHAP